MGYRASKSGIKLATSGVEITKGMLARGDRQHDIAAFFGVNPGRIAEIATGQKYHWVAPAPPADLPPPGPICGRDALAALRAARAVLEHAERVLTNRGGLPT